VFFFVRLRVLRVFVVPARVLVVQFTCRHNRVTVLEESAMIWSYERANGPADL